MKKLITIILVLISGYIQAQQITYTPMTAAGYRFKYFVADSGHTVPFKDTALDRGTTRPGSLVCFTGDSAVYWYNGLYWRPIGANVTTGTITSGIDSATFYNGNLCFWTEGASQCFDLTTYFCNSELNHDSTYILFYTCTGNLIDSLFLPIAYVDVDYPITKRQVGDTTYIGIDALQGQNGLLFGGLVSHDTLYTYDVTAAIYSINGTTYNSSSGSVTLDPSDGTYDRQDIIALDTNENIISITGTPGADPLLPQIDPLSQVFLTSVYVKALSTEPDDINRENIYDENVENWTRTVASGLTVDPDNATNVFHLLKSLDVGTWATTKSVVFARTAGVIPAGTYSILKLFINLKAPLASNGNIQVIFLNGSAQQVGSTTLTAAHGFVKTTAGVYQNITVPMTTGPVTRIQIVFAGVGGGAYLDYIQLQGGIANGVSPYVTNVFRKAATDSVFKVINGVNVFAFRDSIGSGSGNTSFTPNLLIYTNTLTPTGVLANEAAFRAALVAQGPGDNNDSVTINGFRIIEATGTADVGLIEVSVSRLNVIPARMFSANTEITGFVALGGSLLSAGSEIRESAFKGATALRFFSIGDFGYSSNVGDSAFWGCTNLSSIYLPAWNASSSNATLFTNCPSLSSLTVLNTGTAVTFIEGANSFTANILANVASGSVTKYYQEIISTAGQTTFSFTTVPTTSTGYMVYVNGAAIPKTYYSVSTNDIIFSAGLVDGDSVVLQGIE